MRHGIFLARYGMASVSHDTNITQSLQLEPVIPMSRIASLSTGEPLPVVKKVTPEMLDLQHLII